MAGDDNTPDAAAPLSRSARKRRFQATHASPSTTQPSHTHVGTKKLKKSTLLPLNDTAKPRRCIVEYDGTSFHGFQAQEQRDAMRTVQETIEDAIARTTGERVRVQGCSRTDRGVHAQAQVIVFSSRCSTSSDRVFRDALNTRLPEDVVCRTLRTLVSAANEGMAFDPRANASGKIYEYVIVSGPIRPVLDRHHVWYLKTPLAIAKMQQAVAHLIAPPIAKDYTAFTPPKSSQQNTATSKGNVCSVTKVELFAEPLRLHTEEAEGEEEEEWQDNDQRDTGVRIRLRFYGNRFLYKMVRNLVGTLVDVGLGRIQPDTIPLLFNTKDRAKAGQGAPPQGLRLVRVLYKKEETDTHST